MSQLRVDEITDEVGTGSPSFPNGVAASDLTGDVPAARITDALNATGTAPVYACRAWVNFDGTGTVAIRASGNVSSITDNGVGLYRVNFTIAMEDANYSAFYETESANNRSNSGITDTQTSSLDTEASREQGDINAVRNLVAVFR